MGNKLYVGNLAYGVRDEELQQAFAPFGTVSSAKVMMDRDTGRSKGFGFVEMGSDAEAQAAINGMNGQALDGRAIVVNEARPREERPGGFGGGGSRSGGGGYGGGGSGGGGGYGGGSRSSGGSYGDRPQREMFDAVCSECGKTAKVPFRPTSGKPVYCTDCFARRRA